MVSRYIVINWSGVLMVKRLTNTTPKGILISQISCLYSHLPIPVLNEMVILNFKKKKFFIYA